MTVTLGHVAVVGDPPPQLLDVAAVVGSTTPRLFTRPSVSGPAGPCGCGCALTPATSVGFAQDDFARDVLGGPLDPWQRWLVIHAGELRPDGSPRFSTIVVVIARQNGKTWLLVVLTLFWLYRARLPVVVGTSTQLRYAKESWLKAVKLARRVPALRAEIPAKGGVRKTNGEQELVVVPLGEDGTPGDVDDEDACRYLIAASNEEGGRSLTINRLILDELRQHHSYEAWDAAEPATSAVDESQIWALSNAGSDKSVVLNDLRTAALAFIDRGDGDDDLMLAEWSSPEGAAPTDLVALAQANPSLNIRKPAGKLLANARRAVEVGGRRLNGFKTEHMCQWVRLLDPAVDPDGWRDCAGDVDLAHARSRTALCIDVAPDLQHVALYAAAVLGDGRVAVDPVTAWSGSDAVEQALRAVPAELARVRPQVFGWLPVGPSAALAAGLADRRKAGRFGWPPPGVKVEEIRAEVPAVCMGFAAEVKGRRILHPNDPLLNAHAGGAEPLWRGDVWVFSRRGGGHVNAVYAAAGAVHLARTLPTPVGKPRLVVAE